MNRTSNLDTFSEIRTLKTYYSFLLSFHPNEVIQVMLTTITYYNR